ncbi:MAG: hypothetical protein WCK18_00695 [Prolixibacteraceae bacterium]
MNNTFELKKGKLVFEEDKIIITDNASYLKRSRLLSSSILFLFGLYNLWIYFAHNDLHARWSGLLFTILSVVFFVIALLANVQNEIFLKDVKSIKIRRIFFREFLIIKLVTNRTRQVTGIYNAERLEEFVKTISLNQ